MRLNNALAYRYTVYQESSYGCAPLADNRGCVTWAQDLPSLSFLAILALLDFGFISCKGFFFFRIGLNIYYLKERECVGEGGEEERDRKGGEAGRRANPNRTPIERTVYFFTLVLGS